MTPLPTVPLSLAVLLMRLEYKRLAAGPDFRPHHDHPHLNAVRDWVGDDPDRAKIALAVARRIIRHVRARNLSPAPEPQRSTREARILKRALKELHEATFPPPYRWEGDCVRADYSEERWQRLARARQMAEHALAGTLLEAAYLDWLEAERALLDEKIGKARAALQKAEAEL